MTKRYPFAAMGLAILSAFLLLVWQPAFVKKQMIDVVTKKLSDSSPYDITVGRVSGNLLSGITLHEIRFNTKSDHQEILRAPAVGVALSFRALLHKTITITRLDWQEPTLRLVIDGSNPLRWARSSDSRRSAAGLPLTIEHGTIEKGRLIIVNRLVSPAKELVFRDVDMSARVAPRHVSVRMKGQLMDHPISVDVLWANSHLQRADLAWARPGLASANIHVAGDEGTFEIALTTADTRAIIQGNLDLRRRSVQGKGYARHVAWRGQGLDSLDMSYFVSPRRQRAALTAKNLRFGIEGQAPYLISQGHLSVDGLPPRWRVNADLQWADGTTTEVDGDVWRRNLAWRLAWRQVRMANSRAGTWTTDQPGYADLRSDRSVEIRALSLAHGDQNIRVPQAVFGGDSGRIELLFHQINLGSWAQLYRSDLTLEGQINGSLHVAGAWKDPAVDGFVTGHIDKLAFKPAGLSLENIDVDVRSSKKMLEIRRFSGQSLKKGTFDITGRSLLPELAYTLRAQKLTLQGNPRWKGIAEAELHLDGALRSPALSGRIGLDEAAYTEPSKEKKESASDTPKMSSATAKAAALSLWRPGTVDVKMQWPRNGWYRNGISRIETQGDLRLQKDDHTADAILTGTIRSIRGTYGYYGRAFTIESGEIQFPGTIEINPLLNVEASFAGGPTTVYLDLTGPLKQPVLKMHSNPPLSDQDIVSVLVFGQPLSELRSRTGGASGNQEMMQAVGGVLGTYVTKGLDQAEIPALNFDVLNIQPADQGGSQLTVGRYLTPRLFVSYGQSVQGTAEKTLTADYFLTDKWTLQGASDSAEGNYLDWLFRYPLNKRGAAANNPPLPKSPFRRALDVPSPRTPFRAPMQ